MAFEDLRDLLESPVLVLPIAGRSYTVKAASAKVWLQLQSIQARAAAVAAGADPSARDDDMTSVDMLRLALTPAVFEEMVESEVTAPELEHAGMTAYLWQLGQEFEAERMWASAGKAEAATSEPLTTTSTSTAEASTSQKRTAGSGTRSRKSATRPARG